MHHGVILHQQHFLLSFYYHPSPSAMRQQTLAADVTMFLDLAFRLLSSPFTLYSEHCIHQEEGGVDGESISICPFID
jgi:hypothetical protein